MPRKPAEYNKDTHELRLLKINQYISRLKLVMGGTTGLLFFASSDLINTFEKAILVTFIFVNIIQGYISLVNFEDAKTDVEYKLSGNPALKLEKVGAGTWPTNHEKGFHRSTIIFLLLAILVFLGMWFNLINDWCSH